MVKALVSLARATRLKANMISHTGDIMYIESFGKGILVLNSYTAAVDLLDRRGGNYSDRQIFIGVYYQHRLNNILSLKIIFSQ